MRFKVDDLVVIKEDAVSEFRDDLMKIVSQAVFKVVCNSNCSTGEIYSLTPLFLPKKKKDLAEQISLIRFSKEDLLSYGSSEIENESVLDFETSFCKNTYIASCKHLLKKENPSRDYEVSLVESSNLHETEFFDFPLNHFIISQEGKEIFKTKKFLEISDAFFEAQAYLRALYKIEKGRVI